jgi:uncharacterized protein YfaQ (DUF2300 family)
LSTWRQKIAGPRKPKRSAEQKPLQFKRLVMALARLPRHGRADRPISKLAVSSPQRSSSSSSAGLDAIADERAVSRC